jgi:hypothetical protein
VATGFGNPINQELSDLASKLQTLLLIELSQILMTANVF